MENKFLSINKAKEIIDILKRWRSLTNEDKVFIKAIPNSKNTIKENTKFLCDLMIDSSRILENIEYKIDLELE